MNAETECIASTTRVVPLTEAVEMNPRPDRAALPDDLDVSFVPMAAVEAGSGRMDATAIRRFGDVKKGYTTFREGDVLFAKITPCMENGKMAVARGLRNGIGCGSTEFHVLRPRPGVDAQYVYHFVSSARFRAEAAHHMTGAVGQKRVPAAFLQQCEIPLPDQDDQRHIVAELEKQFSRLDEAVANLKRVKANLQHYKAAVLRAAVEGRLVPTEADLARHEGRGYESGAELLQRILAQRQARYGGAARRRAPVDPDTCELPSVPEGWVYCAVSQVCDVASGNTPAGVLDAVRPTGALPWFKVGDMNHEDNQKVMHHADSWLSEAEAQSLGLRIFPPRTLLFPKRGGAIATNKKRVLDQPACADLNVMGITPSEVLDAFFRVWFDSVDLGRLSDGSNVPQINHKDIDPLPLPLPPRAEQERIVAEVDRRLSIVREVTAEVDANLARSLGLRRSVLARAFAPSGALEALA